MHFVAPPANVTGHNDASLNPDCRFFAEFPREIGTPISAGSNLMEGQQAVHRTGVFQNLVFCFVAFMMPLIILLALLQLPAPSTIGILLAGVIVVGLLSRRFGHVSPTNTFVGREGVAVARYQSGGVAWETVRFEDVSQYDCNETIHLIDGQYGGSTFHCAWQRKDGQPKFTIHGAHYLSEDVVTGQEDVYQFSKAAEVVWYQHDHERRAVEIRQSGATTFTVGKFGTAVIEPGVLTLNLLKKSHRLTRENVDSASASGGIFRVAEKGASTVTKRGRHNFALRYVESPQLFVRLVAEVADIPLA